MTVELTPEMESIVSDRLNSGQYHSAQAVLEGAFSALQLQDAFRQSKAPSAAARTAAHLTLIQEEREERARGMEELFARINAEGPFEDLEIDRYSGPPDQREPWLT